LSRPQLSHGLPGRKGPKAAKFDENEQTMRESAIGTEKRSAQAIIQPSIAPTLTWWLKSKQIDDPLDCCHISMN